MLNKGVLKDAKCQTLFIDKVDFHVSLELAGELRQIGEKDVEVANAKIISTNIKNEDEAVSLENEVFKRLKKLFFKEEKALVIQMNEDQRLRSKCNCVWFK